LLSGQEGDAKELGRVVRRQVDTLVSEIRKPVRGIRVGDAELAAMEPRLRLYEAWCDASRKLQALPKGVRPAEADTLLANVAEALRNEETSPEQLDARLKEVRELDVAGLARARLQAQLQDLDTQASELAKQRGEADTLGFRLTYELRPLLVNVREVLAREDLGTARQQLELARRSYFDILCAELSTAVATTRPPRGFSSQEWTELTTDIKERLRQARARADASVDEAFRLYQGAHAIYIRRLIMSCAPRCGRSATRPPRMTSGPRWMPSTRSWARRWGRWARSLPTSRRRSTARHGTRSSGASRSRCASGSSSSGRTCRPRVRGRASRGRSRRSTTSAPCWTRP
ncbi:hypothetical protein ACLESO_53960, partial [Pyxidicoccus sp. 3LG]